ncbi:unnamed protein product [Ectocarpus sp. 13 AM-2016]
MFCPRPARASPDLRKYFPHTHPLLLLHRAATRTRSFLAFVGLYTLVIALHEAGHLVAALSQGIKVRRVGINLQSRVAMTATHGYEGSGRGAPRPAPPRPSFAPPFSM